MPLEISDASSRTGIEDSVVATLNRMRSHLCDAAGPDTLYRQRHRRASTAGNLDGFVLVGIEICQRARVRCPAGGCRSGAVHIHLDRYLYAVGPIR